MSRSVDRSYNEIIDALENIEEYMGVLVSAAKRLEQTANFAEICLVDEVGKKALNDVLAMVDAIMAASSSGEERIRELEHKMKQQKRDYDDLER